MSETKIVSEIVELQKRAEAYERIKGFREKAIPMLKQMRSEIDALLRDAEPSIILGQSRRNGKRKEMIDELHQKMIEGTSFSVTDIEKLYNIETQTAKYIYQKLKDCSDVKVRDVKDGKKVKNLYV